MERPNKRKIVEEITPVIENSAVRHNLIPIEISLTKENGKWYLRIFIYSHDHPVGHDDCENLTRGIGDFLDELIPFKYYLEISSPGLDRKLKSEKEYVIFKGKDIIIKTKEPAGDNIEKKFKGKIVDYMKGLGLRVLNYTDNREYLIPQDNIASVQLNDE